MDSIGYCEENKKWIFRLNIQMREKTLKVRSYLTYDPQFFYLIKNQKLIQMEVSIRRYVFVRSATQNLKAIKVCQEIKIAKLPSRQVWVLEIHGVRLWCHCHNFLLEKIPYFKLGTLDRGTWVTNMMSAPPLDCCVWFHMPTLPHAEGGQA